MDETRKLLDSLMGTNRNASAQEVKKTKGVNFKERHVCKHYLCGFCPMHEELFHSTKRDLGECTKVHSEAMVEEFKNHPDHDKYRREYEQGLRTYLEGVVRDADDWVAREKRNIQFTNQQLADSGPNDVAKQEIAKLREQVQLLYGEAEEVAEKGDIEGSKAKTLLAEQVKIKAEDYESKARAPISELVCEICGLRTEGGDESRRFTHLQGKIHLGYARLRDALAALRKKHREEDQARETAAGRRRGDRDREPRDASGREPQEQPAAEPQAVVEKSDELPATEESREQRDQGEQREPRESRDRRDRRDADRRRDREGDRDEGRYDRDRGRGREDRRDRCDRERGGGHDDRDRGYDRGYDRRGRDRSRSRDRRR